MDAKKGKPSFHEEFAARIIEDLKRGVAPWQRPWLPGESRSPMNPVSGTVYSGINRVMLARRGFEDPRWMTLRQANSLDCRVRKGERSQFVVYWQFSKDEPAMDEDGRPLLDGEGNPLLRKVELARPIVRFSSVFHASQLEGDLPALDLSKLGPTWDPNAKAEAILQASGAVIKHNQRNRDFYSPLSDEISLPPRENFPVADGYYSTALHELGHWSGHASRLNREFGPFGSEPYAREELRAEIASWMLAQDVGIGYDPGQHLAYVNSWIAALEQDAFEIVRACRDAEKIKQYVLGLEQRQHLAQEQPAMAKEIETAVELSQEPARIAEEKVYLAVPYRERNQAKAAGARWDREAKLWYSPQGADLAKLESWLPGKALQPESGLSTREEFARAIQAAGLDLGGQEPIMDGKIHRLPLRDANPGKLDGAYLGYADGVPAGFIQNHKTGEKVTWKATGYVVSEEQKEGLKAEAEQRRQDQARQRREQHDHAAKRAYAKFINAREAMPDQAYLVQKGVPPLGGITGVRVDEECQSAPKSDPASASKVDPPFGWCSPGWVERWQGWERREAVGRLEFPPLPVAATLPLPVAATLPLPGPLRCGLSVASFHCLFQ